MPKYNGEYEGELRPFFDAMRYKLVANKHKDGGRFEDIPIDRLLKLLRQEVDELEEAIAGGNSVEILLESSDCGNFAMMIARVAMKMAYTGHQVRESGDNLDEQIARVWDTERRPIRCVPRQAPLDKFTTCGACGDRYRTEAEAIQHCIRIGGSGRPCEFKVGNGVG